MNFVPLGYADPSMYLLSEAQGGSPWGASTLAGGMFKYFVSYASLMAVQVKGSVRSAILRRTWDRFKARLSLAVLTNGFNLRK